MESEKVEEIKSVLNTWKMTFHGITNTDILTIINELESENKELKKYKLDWLNGEKMHLQAEMEETEFELYCANKALKNRIVELEKEKTEQLKQFGERLKEKAYPLYSEIGVYAIPFYKIDETLEETINEKKNP